MAAIKPANRNMMDGEANTAMTVNVLLMIDTAMPAALPPEKPRIRPIRLQMAANGTKMMPTLKIPRTPNTQPNTPAIKPGLPGC